jgi:ABC-2 type transport system permease protein
LRYRGVWAIISRREFVERARDKGFLASTAITLTILIVVIVLSSVLNNGTQYDLAVVGDESASVGRQVVAAAKLLDIAVTLRTASSEEDARAMVRDGAADAALLDGAEGVLVKADTQIQLAAVIQAVSLRVRSEEALRTSGLGDEEVQTALNQPPLPVRALEPLDDRQRENSTVAYIAVLALYGQIFAYGYWVAAGVVEEKSSRVVEVLLAAVPPSYLLRGKILGIGVLGLVQLVLIGAVGLTTAQLLGALEFPSGALATIGLVLIWFVLGYFFYAGLFAVAGAIVTRQEDLQSTMTPLTIVIVASLFVGIAAIGDPSSTLAIVASLLPPSAPLVMPTRIALGEASLGVALLSAAISIAATIALVPIATKLYSRAVLRTTRVGIRQLLRAERG